MSLVLVQSEAQNLQEQQALHKDLAKKFEAVSKELEATKDTLANTLAQLAEKTSSATSAEIGVAEARQALQVTSRVLVAAMIAGEWTTTLYLRHCVYSFSQFQLQLYAPQNSLKLAQGIALATTNLGRC